jgi:hypothetical protein
MLTAERSKGAKKPASTAINSATFFGSRYAMHRSLG